MSHNRRREMVRCIICGKRRYFPGLSRRLAEHTRFHREIGDLILPPGTMVCLEHGRGEPVVRED